MPNERTIRGLNDGGSGADGPRHVQIRRTGLGMSMRTLQRELDGRALTFKALINELRQELACRYVANARYSKDTKCAEAGGSLIQD